MDEWDSALGGSIRGQYSLVNNVWGDTSWGGGAVFTMTTEQWNKLTAIMGGGVVSLAGMHKGGREGERDEIFQYLLVHISYYFSD